MPNYKNSKIYFLKSKNTDKIYIGSTTLKYLCNRLAKHKSSYKMFKNGTKNLLTCSKIIFDYGDVYIELCESFACDSKDELLKREGYWIKKFKDSCVNRCVAGRTYKEWYDENKEKESERRKKYAKCKLCK